MKTRWIPPVCLLVVVFCSGINLRAWSGGGHKAVAIIACEELDADTRRKVVALLRQHPRWTQDFERKMEPGLTAEQRDQWIFAQAAVWPDMARDLPQYHHPKWHFINEPLFSPKTLANTPFAQQIRTNRELKWNPSPSFDEEFQNAPQTVERARAALSGGAPDKEKALMLSWLIHVVGDLHQPLHTVALFTPSQFKRGDSGGNAIEIFVSHAEADAVTLHSFWDRQLGTELRFREAIDRVKSVRAVPGLAAKAKAHAKELNLKIWVDEGVALAESAVYTPSILAAVAKADATLGDDSEVDVALSTTEHVAYEKAALNLARERVAIGGYRLAEILKLALK